MSSTTGKLVTVEHDGSFDGITQEMTTPAFRQDPYPLWALMRREHPVYRSSEGVWYLTRYADVDAALRDLRLSKDRERMRRWFAQASPRELGRSRTQERLDRSMPHTDPPDHTRLRKLVNVAFTARRVQSLRPRIEAMVDELLDAAVAAGPPTDLMAALAYPLPITVICELVGIPLSDGERIMEWSRQLVNHTEVAPTPAAVEELLRYDSSVQRVPRIVVGQIEVGGQTLGDGEFVSLVLAAANRDPAQFPDPDRLDLSRADNRHVSFGSGSHFCLGARLTRLESEIAIGALLGRLPALRLDTDVIEWRPKPALRGLERLSVTY